MSALLNLCSLGGVIYVAAVIQLSLLIDQFYSIFLIFFILSLLFSCVFILIIIPFLTSIFTIFFYLSVVRNFGNEFS